MILTEIPEMFGAERMLMRRAADEDVFDRLVGVVNGFKQYFLDHGEPVSENPSPGNIAGGITTLEEKSLGAVQKAGRAAVADVIRYGARRRAGRADPARGAGQRCGVVDRTGRGRGDDDPVHHRARHAAGLSGADGQDRVEQRPGERASRAGSTSTRAGARRRAGGGGGRPGRRRSAPIASGAETAAERNGEREIAIWKRGVTL